jgi:hypothetical protein
MQVEEMRHAMLELHRRLIDAQRIQYEKLHGRVQTTSEFLGLVLEHPDFEWIRALSALVAQLDEWRETEVRDAGELDAIVAALRRLIQPQGSDTEFSRKYWEMIERTPEVLIDHVKLTRLLG